MHVGTIARGPVRLCRAPYLLVSPDFYMLCRLVLMVLNVLPITGPRIIRAAKTTMATKTRIKAYSTKPWPFSCGANNMAAYLLSLWICPAVERSGCWRCFLTNHMQKGRNLNSDT